MLLTEAGGIEGKSAHRPPILVTPGLLETKLHPPPERAQTVVRERLLERLRPQIGHKLMLIAAPPGSGKTTLLGTWHKIESARRPVAWLTLDEGDNDPVLLWSYVLEALRRVSVAVDFSPSPQQAGGAGIVDVVLPQLVNRLAEQGGAALVLDDFHRLSMGPARDSVAWFLEHAPSTFHLVISARAEPALPIAAVRAHGELIELRADDLSFTVEEADVFMNDRLELSLAREDIDDLVERTEGWPAGLYLAALSLQGVKDRHAFARTFGGASRHVVDFLIDEVIEGLEPAAQSLLLRCSVLGRMSGDLCDAVLEEDGCGERLAGLSRTNLFLIPLDQRGEWYRFHHLFAQLLRIELEHREPGLAPTLHRRAYAWHRDHGLLDEAIEHAIAAGAFAEAGELISSAWPDYANACRYWTVHTWLRRFPVDVLDQNQELLLADAWVLSLSARREEAERAIAKVEELGPLHAGPLPDGFSSAAASLATLKATIPWGDVGGALQNALRASELEGSDSPRRAVVSWAVGMGLYYSGRSAEAQSWFEESAALGPPTEMWLVAASSLAYCSLIAGEQGRLAAQLSLAEQAAMLAREVGVEEVDGEVFVALGVARMGTGELQEALSHLDRAVAVLHRWGQPTDLAYALIWRASLLLAIGDRDAAAVVIAEARKAVDSCADPGFLRARLSALEEPVPLKPPLQAAQLSQRELLLLRMLQSPLSQRDIGRELYVSRNTVHSQMNSIYRKLGASSRSEALQRARARGLI